MFRLGKQLGAERTGTSVYEIPPKQSICPNHYENPEEESGFGQGRCVGGRPDDDQLLPRSSAVTYWEGEA